MRAAAEASSAVRSRHGLSAKRLGALGNGAGGERQSGGKGKSPRKSSGLMLRIRGSICGARKASSSGHEATLQPSAAAAGDAGGATMT